MKSYYLSFSVKLNGAWASWPLPWPNVQSCILCIKGKPLNCASFRSLELQICSWSPHHSIKRCILHQFSHHPSLILSWGAPNYEECWQIVLIFLLSEGCLTFLLKYFFPKKRSLCDSMDGTGEHYAKWNKPGGEGQIPHDLTYKWNLINKTNKQAKYNQRQWS